jgi:hypothetical protein
LLLLLQEALHALLCAQQVDVVLCDWDAARLQGCAVVRQVLSCPTVSKPAGCQLLGGARRSNGDLAPLFLESIGRAGQIKGLRGGQQGRAGQWQQRKGVLTGCKRDHDTANPSYDRKAHGRARTAHGSKALISRSISRSSQLRMATGNRALRDAGLLCVHTCRLQLTPTVAKNTYDSCDAPLPFFDGCLVSAGAASVAAASGDRAC